MENLIVDQSGLIAAQAFEIDTYKDLMKRRTVDRAELNKLRAQIQNTITDLVKIHSSISDMLHATDPYLHDTLDEGA